MRPPVWREVSRPPGAKIRPQCTSSVNSIPLNRAVISGPVSWRKLSPACVGAGGQQDEEGVRLLAMLHHDLATTEPPLDDAVGYPLGLFVGQQREQRDP